VICRIRRLPDMTRQFSLWAESYLSRSRIASQLADIRATFDESGRLRIDVFDMHLQLIAESNISITEAPD